MIDLSHWELKPIDALFGAIGGLVGLLSHNKDMIPFPRMVVDKNGRKCIYIGFLSPIFIGAFIGLIVDTHPAISSLAGYGGLQVVQLMYDKLIGGSNDKVSEDQH